MEYKGFSINSTMTRDRYIVFHQATGKQVFETYEGFDAAWQWIVDNYKAFA